MSDIHDDNDCIAVDNDHRHNFYYHDDQNYDDHDNLDDNFVKEENDYKIDQ
jgi:hypothetical protein